MDWLCGLTLGGYQLADSRDVPERHQPWYWALSYWENCLTGLGDQEALLGPGAPKTNTEQQAGFVFFL